jgi:hypothetical protein
MTQPDKDKDKGTGTGAPSTEDTAPKTGLTAGTLRQWIKEEIANLAPGKSTKDTPQGTEGGGNIRQQVVEALGQLKTKEERDKRDAEVDKMLEEWKKPAEEVTPRERRKVEKLMRWGD